MKTTRVHLSAAAGRAAAAFSRGRRDLLAAEDNVLLAGDGREALELLRSQPPDLVVTDLMTPSLPGRELVRRSGPTGRCNRFRC